MTQQEADGEDEEGLEIWPLIESYCTDVDYELTARLEAWPPNFSQIHVHEVIGGMLARQATLSKDVARAPALWTGHSAPILLRAEVLPHFGPPGWVISQAICSWRTGCA